MSIAAERPDELNEILSSDFVNCWVPISQSTLTGSVASVTFSSIPSTFRTLVLEMQLRSDRATEFEDYNIRLNGDSGNNYDTFRWTGRGNSTIIYEPNRATSSMTPIGRCSAAGSLSNNFAPSMCLFPGYKLTDRHKWCHARSVHFGNVSADSDLLVAIGNGRWRNTSAVTSVQIIPNVGPNFVSGSVLSLYGIL